MAKHAGAPNGEMSEKDEPAPTTANRSDRAVSESSRGTDEPTLAVGSEDSQERAGKVVRNKNKVDATPTTEGRIGQKQADAADEQLSGLSDVEGASIVEEASSPVEIKQGQNDEPQTNEDVDSGAKPLGHKRFWSEGRVVALGAAVVVALGCLTAWLGFRTYEVRQAQAERNLLVAVARQGALNLTTIDYARVDADVQRILDSSTGTFHDDFENRSRPFVDVVKKVQSKSEGTVTEAGLESQDGNQAQVLVAVSVKTTNAGAPEQDPRRWRMRISVEKVGGGAKVSNVMFVPEQG